MIGKTHEVVDASPGEGYIAPDMSIESQRNEPWGTSFVAEVLDNGKVVVWPDESPEYVADFLGYTKFNKDQPRRHYFLVDVTLTPAKEMA